MNTQTEQKIISELITYITETESVKGEITLFSWSHSLRSKLYYDYGIEDLDTARRIYIEAYNATHPHSVYKPINHLGGIQND